MEQRLGIWAVLDACDDDGSVGASIRNQKANRFARLHRLAPRLKMVAFNGQTAGSFAAEFADAGFRTAVLPSSSPAHAGRSFEQKLAVWRAWWAVSPS
jgi:hypoxanthine-DNA glycosylase